MAMPILAICDTDLEYLDRLYEVMIQTKNFIFDIRLYTSVERFNHQDVDPISVLLISEELHQEEFIMIPQYAYVVLGSHDVELQEYHMIRKFNKTEKIIQKLYELYYETSNAKAVRSECNAHIIGFYSPINRCYQTSFALTYGQILAQTCNVLYLNLEGFSAPTALFQEQYSQQLTDFIYLLKNVPDKISYKLDGIIESVNGLDFIPFCQSDLDIRQIESVDLLTLMGILVSNKKYDYILLDLSDCLQDVYGLLRESDSVYTIIESDEIAVEKVNSYESSLLHLGYEDILQKTKKIKIPQLSNMPSHMEKLIYSELAEYTKELAKEHIYENLSRT